MTMASPVAPPDEARFTEAVLLAALRRRFTFSGNGGAGRYAFLTHVRTGAAWDQQEIDALVVCLWPSDHHSILGFEVKCSRTDWLREIRPDTSKSERTRALCDSFTVVAPANVVEIGELPTGWGLLLASRKEEGGGIRLYQQVPPTPRFVADDRITRSFLVAMLRASGAVPGMTSGRRRLPSSAPHTCEGDNCIGCPTCARAGKYQTCGYVCGHDNGEGA